MIEIVENKTNEVLTLLWLASSDVEIAETIRDDYRANGISCRVRQGRRL